MNIEEINKEINALKFRNKKVEADKAWETSLFRKIIISTLTYLAISIFFIFAKFPNPFINAIVPTLGFLFSTLSMSYFKKIWMKWFYKN